MFLLMILIGVGFGWMLHRNGALLESGSAETREPAVRATVDGKAVNCYVAEDLGRE